ncbi:helix-turn-helix domain-containing protein [Larkinella terrae]|uniref:Helix-turn-helix domain-containing protein n=1 Tax=Larkinella terrae TaxID=2025311 RepID=A0A7K0EH67_9BACT|nr:helix-turn-helix transcriptional regulator [Larkinella terrae]MRS60921.1 helix-turn-helix domain-containing protein [Larkinella terrae]
MDVSNNIRSIREKKGLTQVDIANRLGTERSNYARLENRDVNLTLKQIQEIAEALEVSVYEIIGMPQTDDLRGEQTEILQRLEEKLKMTEEALKDKKRNIKLYKTFIEWTRDKFVTQFTLAVLHAIKELNLREITFEDYEELGFTKFNLTEEELKQIGEYMFKYGTTDYMVTNFVASSGFITEKWFIDAYNRKSKEQIEKKVFAEVKKWVNGVFEFLEEE